MEDKNSKNEEININLGDKKLYFVLFFILLVASITSYYFGTKSNKIDLEKLELYDAYQYSFNTCKEYCRGQVKTGYLRVETETNLKCFCWSDITKFMEET